MRYILFAFLLSAKLAISQQIEIDTNNVSVAVENESVDTLNNNSFIAKLFNNDSLTKHHHIVDLTMIDLRFSMGYNYLYSITPNFRVGIRMGFSLRHLDRQKYPTSILTAYLNCSASYRIWKSVYAEASASLVQGYGISVILGNGNSDVGKPEDFYGKSTSILPMYAVGLNSTLYNHLFIKSGLNIIHDVVPKLFYKGFYLSLGYKF